MNNRDIAIKKEALIMHGEWLRLQTRLNLESSISPLKLVSASFRLLAGNSQLSLLSSLLGRLIPNKRVRLFVNVAASTLLLAGFLRKFVARR